MKNKNYCYIACLLAGIGVGIYGTAGYFKTKYETIANSIYAELEEERAAYRAEKILFGTSSVSGPVVPEAVAKQIVEKEAERQNPWALDKPSLEKIKQIKLEEKYETEKEPDKIVPGPYVIAPDDFGAIFEYECVSLVYYADGVLVDENQNVVTDVEDMIGEDSLEHFGEYEYDSVYVRNDERCCDYEILLDERKWSDVKHRQAR